MRSIRLDDYPDGNPGWDISKNRDDLSKAVAVFEEFGVPYFLGVSPAHLHGPDFEFLNQHVRTGSVIMHGFTHLLEFRPWERIVETWPEGGEFRGMSPLQVRSRYDYCHRMLLTQVRRYDPSHFVAPFNCYTQATLDGLQGTGVRWLHTCDKEWDSYGYAALNHGQLEPVIARFQVTYDYAHKVIDHLDDPGQITLHWIFDRQVGGWVDHYRRLCEQLLTLERKQP